ncbi:MAG: M20/M25/M40 family metallo-hydrolase [Bacteroidetes bacterium]|uniref:M20/M25/M40 family metallo-hydrolase n=1 Tax=Phnomibacter sp. TaxID=2836217 RepID=UPI002FDE420D|nr:M20/M25/M40 family metallo-hydrolase [Bacteroidota bacterium]
MNRKIYSLGLCLGMAAAAVAQDDAAKLKQLSDEIMLHSTAYENLRYLCKQVGPRLSGSPQAQKSVEATARMLKEAGADTVYLQPCMVPHWERGAKEQGVVTYGGKQKALNVCALGMSIGTPTAGIKAGVIEVRNFEELEKLPDATVKGKIVFFNYPMRPELIQGGYGDAVRYRSNGPVAAAKKGAVAVMIRSVTHSLDNYPHTGTTRYDDAVKKIPAFACSTMDAEWLSKQLKLRMPVQLFLKSNCKQGPDVLSYNVVGEIRGSEKPEEIITAGGHLDSWDLGEGAHDDGAGCVQSIEVIRAIKALGLKPKRTIRAVMFMNEENGLRGGNAYAEFAKKLNENHIFAVESDAGGFGVQTLGISGQPHQYAKIKSWEKLFKPFGIYELSEGGGGADIGPLKPLGTVLSGVNPGTQRYFDHHHAANDVFEAVHKRELELGAFSMVAICWLVSEYGL